MMELQDLSLLKYSTLQSVEISDDNDEVTLVATTGGNRGEVNELRIRLYHQQDCCESVELNDVTGDWADLIGQYICEAEVVTHDARDEGAPKWPEDQYLDCATWTFYKLRSRKGEVVMRWLGESNGYYSERVTIWLDYYGPKGGA